MTKNGLKFGRILAAAGAFAMVSAPVVGHANTRAADASAVAVEPVKLSQVTRASAKAEKKSDMFGGSTLLAVFAAAAVIAGIVIIADDDDVSSGA